MRENEYRMGNYAWDKLVSPKQSKPACTQTSHFTGFKGARIVLIFCHLICSLRTSCILSRNRHRQDVGAGANTVATGQNRQDQSQKHTKQVAKTQTSGLAKYGEQHKCFTKTQNRSNQFERGWLRPWKSGRMLKFRFSQDFISQQLWRPTNMAAKTAG